jgi:RHH-type rel operon transcriptional repressor/antitoxin RelB
LKKRVDEVARRTGRSKAWVIKKSVESHIEDVEDIEMSEQRLADPKDNVISSDELMSRL